MNATHPANTISDDDWHAMRVRQVRCCPNLIRFGSAEAVRQTRLAGLQWRAARMGWN